MKHDLKAKLLYADMYSVPSHSTTSTLRWTTCLTKVSAGRRRHVEELRQLLGDEAIDVIAVSIHP